MLYDEQFFNTSSKYKPGQRKDRTAMLTSPVVSKAAAASAAVLPPC
jgi:hypothetical protein